MKSFVCSLVIVSLALVSCENNASFGSDWDPLRGPGSRKKSAETAAHLSDAGVSSVAAPKSPTLKPGMGVVAIMDNTSFFKTKPKGIADANSLLKINTPMTVLADEGDYVKVKLKSGQTGYVLSPQIADKSAMASLPPILPAPTEQPLPSYKPGDAPAPDAIPTVADPDAAASAVKPSKPAVPPVPEVPKTPVPAAASKPPTTPAAATTPSPTAPATEVATPPAAADKKD